MALRNIVEYGDEVLRKTCRPVPEITERIQTLVDDMIETMHDAEGVGLAAPQVGVLRRIFVVDIGDGPIVLINPEIVETSGEQTDEEGCLSLPGRCAPVTRANYVKIRGLDREGNEVEYEGTELLARAFQHEYDHLDGILYIDRASAAAEYEE
ncbi:MAG: peptide deformylase [Anaerovoracaceae bacterium]